MRLCSLLHGFVSRCQDKECGGLKWIDCVRRWRYSSSLRESIYADKCIRGALVVAFCFVSFLYEMFIFLVFLTNHNWKSVQQSLHDIRFKDTTVPASSVSVSFLSVKANLLCRWNRHIWYSLLNAFLKVLALYLFFTLARCSSPGLHCVYTQFLLVHKTTSITRCSKFSHFKPRAVC